MECSTAWDGLPAWGTAAPASWWLALEQPGPWGRDALTESHLDPTLGAALAAEASASGGRVLLIRRPGHHADAHVPGPRRVFIAGGGASSPWLVAADVADPSALLALPWAQLAGAAVPDLPGYALADPVLLVCTNAKRDRCCALRGRPVAHALAVEGRSVWECSHTGGHRFAPTGVVLPIGQVIARITPELGRRVLDAAASGRLAAESLGERHDRGLSRWPPRLAAAVSFVAAASGEVDPGALSAQASPEGALVRHRDGRSWALALTEVTGEPLPDSCGTPAKPSRTWRVKPLPGGPAPA